MQEGKFSNNHQKLPMATSSLDDQNGQPYTREVLSHKQPKEATLVAPPHGRMSEGHNKMTNNIQDSILNSSESNPQSQASNKTPNHAPQNPRSKAPVGPFREHDLYMPITNVVRIIKSGLPPNAKVTNEAKDMVQECVSSFISFVTSEANETCKTEHRKTITAEDLIGAMSRLGFEDYVEPLMMYLHKHRESMMLPSVPKRGAGNNSTEASAVIPITDLLPPAPVCPQFDKFSAAVTSSGSFGNRSGTSTGPITMGQGVDTGTNCDGSGPSLALGIVAGPGGNECGGLSRSPQAELEFNDLNGDNE